jgi:DNA-directed RNA polymerase subunit H (RpoH/RPB5)
MFKWRNYTLLQGWQPKYSQSGNAQTIGLIAFENSTNNLIAVLLHNSFVKSERDKLLTEDITNILSMLTILPLESEKYLSNILEILRNLLADSGGQISGSQITKEDIKKYESAISQLRTPNFIFNDILLVSNRGYVDGEAGMQKIARQVQYQDMLWAFELDELNRETPSHRLQPHNIHILSSEEEKQFLTTRAITKNKLPQGYTMDPLFKFLGVREGRIVRTISDNNLPGTINSLGTRWRVAFGGKPPPRPKTY